jgi:hypothetical protein
MLNLPTLPDPKKALEELPKDFGGVKQLQEARNNYNDSLMNCYTAILAESEKSDEPVEAK